MQVIVNGRLDAGAKRKSAPDGLAASIEYRARANFLDPLSCFVFNIVFCRHSIDGCHSCERLSPLRKQGQESRVVDRYGFRIKCAMTIPQITSDRVLLRAAVGL